MPSVKRYQPVPIQDLYGRLIDGVIAKGVLTKNVD
jgi:hypothetical protein